MSVSVETPIQRILHTRVVSVIRAQSTAWALGAAEILAQSALDIIEITFTVPGAADVITALRTRFPQVLVGAGTVTDARLAERAIAAGAQFLVSPALSFGMTRAARRQGVLAVPGAYTPTEVLMALEEGAELIKIFPAESGGPRHIRAILAPLPHARLLPTGGIGPESAGAWLAAGAVAVGLGSALIGASDRPLDAEALRARIALVNRSLVVRM